MSESVVTPSVEVRKANWAAFVSRALLRAKKERGWSPHRVSVEAGIGSNTVRRWRDGQWGTEGPKAEQVVAFCDTLGIPVLAAFSILWPSRQGPYGAATPEPFADAQLLQLARVLEDPNTPEGRRLTIRGTLSYLLGEG